MALTLLLSLLTLQLCNAELVTVKVAEGLLEGALVEMSTGLGQYYSFKGIPYAQPPVGSLRFKAPVPVKKWTGVRNATTHGPVCIQFDIFENKYIPSVSSEDCLYLNVYSPSLTPVKPLPVLIFIHGGGYMSGSGNETDYGADFLVKQDVIVVTINYRLDALGFLVLNTKEVPGNAGLKDQALAIQWVHENINKFGGDPNQITMMGQSAGSSSVVHHMISPKSRGLFKRAILMSGVPLCDWAIPFEQYRRSFALGRLLGNDTSDPNVLLDFLQRVNVTDLLNTRPAVLSQETIWNKGVRMFSFVPTPELDFGQERFIKEPVIKSLKKGNIADLDVIIGYTSEEYLFEVTSLENGGLEEANAYKELLVPREILLNIPPKEVTKFSERVQQKYFNGAPITNKTMANFLKFGSDHVFVYSINRFLKYLPTGKAKKFLYKFYSQSARNRYTFLGDKYNISVVSHIDDLRYLFDAKRDPVPVDINSREYKLIEQSVSLYANFAKYGNPTPDGSLGAIWPEHTPDTRAYMKINDTLIPGTDLDAEIVDFWTRIHKDAGTELP